MEGVCWLPLKVAARYKPGSERVARFLYGLYPDLYNVLSGLCCCIFAATVTMLTGLKIAHIYLPMLQAHLDFAVCGVLDMQSNSEKKGATFKVYSCQNMSYAYWYVAK